MFSAKYFILILGFNPTNLTDKGTSI